MDTSILDEVEVGTRTPKQTARQRNRMDDVMEKLFEHLEKQCAFARGGTGRGRRWFEEVEVIVDGVKTIMWECHIEAAEKTVVLNDAGETVFKKVKSLKEVDKLYMRIIDEVFNSGESKLKGVIERHVEAIPPRKKKTGDIVKSCGLEEHG